MKNVSKLAFTGCVALAAGLYVFANQDEFMPWAPWNAVEFDPPDWDAIAAWPQIPEEVAFMAQPDPNITVAVLILDDSGSMGTEMTGAKAALVEALAFFAPTDEVAVMALNAGLILPVSTVAEAQRQLEAALRNVQADGTTPLTEAVVAARDILSETAAMRRGFGTYRIIVTTDGEADDEETLRAAVGQTVTRTPIQIATIATKSLPNHALNAKGFTNFTTIAGVGKLAEALAGAIAENASFDPVTSFEEE